MKSFVTTRSSRMSLCGVIALLLASGCGGSDDDTLDSPCTSILPGDLVVTEVMANPAGADEGGEWIEIYNATGAVIDLVGVSLGNAKPDGTGAKLHRLPELQIMPDDYFVLGGSDDAARLAFVDYGYGSAIGSLRNTEGKISLSCGGAIIDEANYGESENEASSVGLDGNKAPDALANDDLNNWCTATIPASEDDAIHGSPGAANEPCNVTVPDTCRDNGSERPLVKPTAGQLVISEIMADPSATPDQKGEWFEVTAIADVDLNGVVFGTEAGMPKTSLSSADCLAVNAGQTLLLVRDDDSAKNGMLPSADGTFSFGLTNTDGSLFVGLGDTVIDQVTWNTSKAGTSRALLPTALDAVQNDDDQNWTLCETASYGAGDHGTPKAGNEGCGETSGDTCMDGDTMRAIVTPGAGQLSITEVMPDPKAVNDSPGEWFEITTTQDVDLNGLQIGDKADPFTVKTTILAPQCLRLAAGSYAIFARSDISRDNGGLPAPLALFDFNLVNKNGTLAIGIGETVLDSLTWEDSTPGASLSKDENGAVCDATSSYGDGDLGTPDEANPTCP